MLHTAASAWQTALQYVMKNGDVIKPRGMTCKEVRGVTLTLATPELNMIVCPHRKLNYHFMVAEWVWMALGRRDVASIAAYNKNIMKYSDDGVELFGAYGPKITQQLSQVVKLLLVDPDSRQAIIQIYNPVSLFTVTKDVPCTLAWQFFIRNGKLNMHVTMRSNDLWLGFPYDIFNFTQFQRAIALKLGRDVGVYTHHVGSLHLYEEHWAPAYLAANNPETTARGIKDVPDVLFDLDAIKDYYEGEYEGVQPTALWASYAAVLRHRFDKTVTLPADVAPLFK